MPTAKQVVLELEHDERAFLARNSPPALLFEPAGFTSDRVHVDTLDHPFFVGDGFRHQQDVDEVGEVTDVLAVVDVDRMAAGLAVEHVGPDARLEWLTKSARNPFGAMITLGRAPNNDIVVATATVSKVHAVFAYEPGGWVISDSRSSNGTLLNGVRLATGVKRPVCDGDEISFGSETHARFVLPSSLVTLLSPARRAHRRREPGWA